MVTGEGKHLIATPQQNSELYWALGGGGGGTYGVVLSMTTTLHPEGPVAGPSLSFASPNVRNETYWKAVGVFFKHLDTIVKGTNNTVQYEIWNNNFSARFVLLDQNISAVNGTWGSLLAELNGLGIAFNTTVQESDTFVDYYNMYYRPLPYGFEPPSTFPNSRFIPELVVIDSDANTKLMEAIALVTETGEFVMDCIAQDINGTSHPDNAVLPAWRESIALCIMNGFWNGTAPLSVNLEVKNRMVDVYAPAMDAATPGSGVYLNEIDPLYKGDFKETMHGANYPRLLEIKHKYDPDHLFYGYHAVGGDEFTIDGSGRLCYKGTESGCMSSSGWILGNSNPSSGPRIYRKVLFVLIS